MPKITINIDNDIFKILKKRATDNLLTLKEQVEDILRKSAVRTKKGTTYKTIKIDDKLVSMFSRDNRGRKKKN